MRVLWMLGSLWSAVGPATPAPWTPAQVEQLAVEALLRDGISLAKLGDTLELSPLGNGRWSLLVEGASGKAAPRARVFEQLSGDPEAAAAEVAAAARSLLEVEAPRPAPKREAEKSKSTFEEKAELLRQLSDPGFFGDVSNPARLFLTQMVIGAGLCPMGVWGPASQLAGSSSRVDVIAGGAALCLLGSLSGPLFSDHSDVQLKFPLASFLMGIGTAFLAGSYSPKGTSAPTLPAGLRPGNAVTGGALIAGGIATLAIVGQPYCGRDEQFALAGDVAGASPEELPERLSRFERCLRRDTAQVEFWWIPLAALAAGAAGVIGTGISPSLGSNHYLIAYGVDFSALVGAGLVTGLEGLVPSVLRRKYLDALKNVGLTLEPEIAPGGMRVRGRF